MSKVKVKGRTAVYMYMPIITIAFLVGVNIWMYTREFDMGIVFSAFVLVYSFTVIAMYIVCKARRVQELVDFATGFAQVQKQLIKDLELPYGLMDSTGKIMWANTELAKLVGDSGFKYIFTLFQEVTEDTLAFEEGKKSVKVTYKDRNYALDLDFLGFDENFHEGEEEDKDNCLIAFYLFDETEENALRKKNMEQRLVTGLIYLDNYDDAIESVEDVRRSLLSALIERKINKYFSSMNAIVKKIEKDKYFLAIQQKYVSQLQSNKFSILDEIKSVNIGNEMSVTASIGLGVNGETYVQSCDYARVAIDLALGRGGDQAVLKDGDKIYFYGGKTKQVEKNTRVKARVKAHALRELLETKEKVLIMGHQLSDIDAFGAAVGIYRVCRAVNKRAYIILNEITTSVKPLVDRFKESEDYEDDMFIKNGKAMELVDSNTAVVVVDVNRPSYVECPDILKSTKAIVVLDHHRQSSEVIEGAALSYIEPYASSASEMVAEILQYIYDGLKLKQVEADALYGGIILDTQNFTNNTGVRTFEAAAYLRKNGANVMRVRQLFRDDMEDFRAKAEAIKNVEVYEEKYAITVLPADGLDSPTVVGAQTANELINIRGIKASFVLTDYNDKIYISARSTDEISVQLIMERLGGGGHLNTAGAQLECSVEEARAQIKGVIDEMTQEKEI